MVAKYLYCNAVTPAGTFFDKSRSQPADDLPAADQPAVRTFGLCQLGFCRGDVPAAAVDELCQALVMRWRDADRLGAGRRFRLPVRSRRAAGYPPGRPRRGRRSPRRSGVADGGTRAEYPANCRPTTRRSHQPDGRRSRIVSAGGAGEAGEELRLGRAFLASDAAEQVDRRRSRWPHPLPRRLGCPPRLPGIRVGRTLAKKWPPVRPSR